MTHEALLDALREEVAREVVRLQAEAEQENRRLLEQTRQQLASERAEALAEERRREGDEARRVVSQLRLEQVQARLVERRRLLTQLRREAEARLRTAGGVELLARLVAEVIPELGTEPLEFEVAPADEEALRGYLSRERPDLLARARVIRGAELGGGVKISLGRGQVLDNSLPSRLTKAWPLLEREIAALLFGDGDGRM